MGKRRKNYYVDKSNSKKKKFDFSMSEKLSCGSKGFLISHDRGKDRRCTQESLRLLNHFSELWYGLYNKSDQQKIDRINIIEDSSQENQATTDEVLSKNEESDSDDIELALSKEVNELKESVKNTQGKYRFNAVKTGCNNLIFIKTKDLLPSILVQKMVQELMQGDEKHFATPTVLKLHPVDVSCKAYLQDIKNALETYLPHAFDELIELNHALKSFDKEFTIIYRHRSNDNLKRNDLYDAVTSVVADLGSDWRYNCRANTFFLIVEVLKAVCCIGVSVNYTQFKKLNIKELQLNNIQSINSKETKVLEADNVKTETVDNILQPKQNELLSDFVN